MSHDFLDATQSHKFFRAFYVPFTRSEDGTGYCRVIHSYVVNDKINNFLLFRPDAESFGKLCLEKCKKFLIRPLYALPKAS